MTENKIMIKVCNVSKTYRLGEIGGTSLTDEVKRVLAKIRRKDDPTKKIGAKNYNKGEKFKALDNVSFEINKGERVGIIGHNGAGKSTILKLISRVTGPTEGEIYLDGRVASMLEVGTGFHSELTGRENIYMNGAILGMTKKEIDSKIEDIIEFSELRQFIDTPVKRYSSGMYVKLAFSVAAHLDSEIMIMDEVLAVGDVAFQNKCLQKMKDVSEQKDKTILYVSHNMGTIRQLCERVIVFNHGKVIFQGDVEDGIKIYFNHNKNESLPTYYDFNNINRSRNLGLALRILSFKILNKETSSFEQNELFNFSIKIQSAISSNQLRLLISVRDENNLKIGTAMTPNFTIDKDVIDVFNFSFDLSSLSQGLYRLRLSLGEVDGKGLLVVHDDVDTDVLINLVDEYSMGFKWNREKLGAVFMNPIIIKN